MKGDSCKTCHSGLKPESRSLNDTNIRLDSRLNNAGMTTINNTDSLTMRNYTCDIIKK